MTKKERFAVYDKYNGRCAYCGHKIAYKDMQVDHIVPQRLGGENSLSNYNPACSCWIAEPSSAEIDTPVAWCEIPKFKEM